MDTCKNCGACPSCGRQYTYGYYPYWIYPTYYPYWNPVINTAGTVVTPPLNVTITTSGANSDSNAWNYGHTASNSATIKG